MLSQMVITDQHRTRKRTSRESKNKHKIKIRKHLKIYKSANMHINLLKLNDDLFHQHIYTVLKKSTGRRRE